MGCGILRDFMEIFDGKKRKANVKVEFFRKEQAILGKNNEIVDFIGKPLKIEEGHNINTNAGLNYAAQAMAVAVTPFSYIGVGSGSNAEDPSDTELQTEIERVGILSYDFPSTGVVRFRAIFEANQGNGSVREFGLFNALVAGTMGVRYVLGASYTKDTTLSIRVTWTITTTDT